MDKLLQKEAKVTKVPDDTYRERERERERERAANAICKLLQKKTILTGLCVVTFFISFRTKLQKLIFRHY